MVIGTYGHCCCPGHCPTCGRAYPVAPVVPALPVWPYMPTLPYHHPVWVGVRPHTAMADKVADAIKRLSK